MTESKNITLEDVRSVIIDNDLHLGNTNANKIRNFLGRGSLATIQKHLDFIRDEKKETVKADVVKIDFSLIKTAIEKASSLAVADVLAKSNADVQAASEKLVTALTERDAALETADAAEQERDSLQAECETLKDKLVAQENALFEMQKMFEKIVSEKAVEASVARSSKKD